MLILASLLDGLLKLVLVLAILSTKKTCRPGWSADGVRPNGWTVCRPVPPPHCGEPVPPDDAPCPHDDRTEPMAIYCTGGTHPIVNPNDGRTIGCQR